MFATRRTEIQITFLLLGIAVWGYGSRADIDVLKYIGIGFFAAATLLRLLKKQNGSDVTE